MDHREPYATLSSTEEAFSQWSTTVPAQCLFSMEAEVLRDWLAGIFGYRLVQAGEVIWPGEDPVTASAIGHKVLLKTAPARTVSGTGCSSCADRA